MSAVYSGLCPNCGGDITGERLEAGLPCDRCLPQPAPEPLCALLRRQGTLQHLAARCQVEERLAAFTTLFERCVGAPPSTLQITWTKRVLAGDSFAIATLPGTGKTTFGLVMALFQNGHRLLIVPTRLLVQQAADRLQQYAQRAGQTITVAVRTGETPGPIPEAFDILVTTLMYFHRHHAEIGAVRYQYIFVDDVDALLRNSRATDHLFGLLGFEPADLQWALATTDPATLAALRQKKRPTVLLLSSATVRPRGRRALLFQRLLGFDVQRAAVQLRAVTDAARSVGSLAEAVTAAADFIRTWGGGGLVFLPLTAGRAAVAAVTAALRDQGVTAQSYDEADLAAYTAGAVQVLVGLAHSQNPLVRGLDLPHVVRYALFLDVPKMTIPLRPSEEPGALFALLLALRPLLPAEQVSLALGVVRRALGRRPEQIARSPRLQARLAEVQAWLATVLADPTLPQRIAAADDLALAEEEGQIVLVVGDAAAYLQASARTSRLFPGGLARGLSIVYVQDRKAFRSLQRRLRLFTTQEIEWHDLDRLDLARLMAAIDADRALIRRWQAGEIVGRLPDLFRTTLLVVESPTKARTIARFFGRPQARWVDEALTYELPLGDRLLVLSASLGHVVDLVTQQGVYGVLVDGVTRPIYGTIKQCTVCGSQFVDQGCPQHPRAPARDKRRLLQALGRVAFEVQEVLIGTDPDAEGEKIAYDLLTLLRPMAARVARIEFHEVTPRAFQAALQAPRTVDRRRVQAQVVRRIADRWVGFALSQRLWAVFGRRGLSAGRVQTPVLGWVIERADQAQQEKAVLRLRFDGYLLEREYPDLDLAEAVWRSLDRLRVRVVGTEERRVNPSPPFVTATVLREAAHLPGLSASRTMALLQELFERGLITYHRTDSPHIAPEGRAVARTYLEENGLGHLFEGRSWGPPGVHEAIRPTRPQDRQTVELLLGTGLLELSQPRLALRLYDLIFRRFLASQCRPALVRYARLRLETPVEAWEAEVPVALIEPGFHQFLPLDLFPLAALDRPPVATLDREPLVWPFTEGTLVEEMRRQGLGRPSTYAKIVQTLKERRYVQVVRGFLYPTAMGREVYAYLAGNFPQWVSPAFTRDLEAAMDAIEEGAADPEAVLARLRPVLALAPTGAPGLALVD